MTHAPRSSRIITFVLVLAGSCQAPALALASDATTTTTTTTTPAASPPTASPVPRRNGKGLIIGAAAAGGVGLALNAGRVAWQLRGCRRRGLGVLPGGDYDYGGCLISSFGDVFLSIPAWFANLASIGLAAGGGALRGKWEARSGRPRDARKMIIAGATMVGVGGAAYLAARFARLAAIGCIDRSLRAGAGDDLGRTVGCYRGVYAGTTIGIQLALSTAAAGAGVLAFGDQYRRERARTLQVEPVVSSTYLGVQLGGRF